MNKFYVYAYMREDNTPYYIGKGTGRRAFYKKRRCPPPRDKNRIVFLFENLNEDEAFEWEEFFIKAYGRQDNGTGILRNLTDGGEGMSGCSPYNKGISELNGMYGKEHKPETKQILSKQKEKYEFEVLVIKTGNVIKFRNLNKFCRDMGLSKTGLANTLKGKSRLGKTYTQHKGYKLISKKEIEK